MGNFNLGFLGIGESYLINVYLTSCESNRW